MSGPSSPPPSAGSVHAHGDDEHDAWLRAALRHAPDADASPPESLRRTILDEARAAAFASVQAGRGSATTRVASAQGSVGLVGTIAAFWTWLGRPAVAAGFASVTVATLVGILWWDRPLDETLPSATPPVAAVRQASPTAERAAAKPEAVAPTPVESPAPRVPSTSTPSIRPAPATAPTSEDKRARADLDRAPAFKRRADAAPQATATATAPVDAAPAPSVVAPVAATPQPFPEAVPPEAPEHLAKAAAARPAARTSASERSRDEPRSNGSVGDALGRVAAASAPGGVVPASPASFAAPSPPAPFAAAPSPPAMFAVAPSPPAPPALAAQAAPRSRMALGASVPAASTSRPLVDVLRSITGEPARWSVRRANGEQVAPGGALRVWLLRVDATAGWKTTQAVGDATADRQAENTIVTGPAATLTLLHDGQIDTVVRIDAGRVVVERHDGTATTSVAAALSAQAAASLAVSLPADAR